MLATFAKGLALTGIGTPLELDPFSETNYVTFPLKGGITKALHTHSKILKSIL